MTRAPNVIATAQDHQDERLRGRTYAIPFEDVWTAANALVTVGLPRWRLVAADDEEGVIRAEASTMFGKKIDDVVILISLDENAQTRVDARASRREGGTDWGRNARRLRRFFAALDGAVVEARRQRLASRKGGAPAGRT